MSKKKYKSTGREITLFTGFIQASMLLDAASHEAVNKLDHDKMIEAAKEWMEMSLAMRAVLSATEGDSEVEDDDLDSKRETGPVGFGVTAESMIKWKEKNERN